MKKRQERVAMIELDRWLRRTFPTKSISWSEISDPHPDWYLTIDNDSYGVEATTIVPKVKAGKSLVLEPSISASIGDFIDEVESKAISRGILSGGYAIALGHIPGGRKSRERISSAILDYIEQTKEMQSAESLVLCVFR